MSVIFLHNRTGNVVAHAIISPEDYELISQFKWYLVHGYARTSRKMGNKTETVLMHRLVMNAKKGQIVDHIN